MGKKNKEKHPQPVVRYPINSALEQYQRRYHSLLSSITELELRTWFEESILHYDKDRNISWEFDALDYVEKRMFSKIRDLILEGDLDLEISVIDYFLSNAKLILRKLGYQGIDAEGMADKAISDTIENYQDGDNFQTSLVKRIRLMMFPKPEVVPPIQSQPVEPKKKNLEKIDTVKEESTPLNTIQDTPKKKELVLPLDNQKRQPSPLEEFGYSLDIIAQSPLDDETYIQFLSLKYGYYHQQYYSLEEICTILNISRESCTAYYHQSLQFIKDWYGSLFEKYYTYTNSYEKKTNES